MRSYSLLLFIFLLLSCSSSDLKKDFDCSRNSYINLTEIKDFRRLFTLSLPKDWKINLYYDHGQSSIYAADTTLNLTETTLIDASYIHAPIFFDTDFKQKLSSENLQMGLTEVKSKDISYLNNKAYYSLAGGKRGKFDYHILNVFTKVNSDNFLHVKAEVYGDSLVNERLCKAIGLIDEIELQ